MLNSITSRFGQIEEDAQLLQSDITAPVADPRPEVVTTGSETASDPNLVVFGIVAVLLILNAVIFWWSIIHLIRNPRVRNHTMWLLLCLLVPFASWIYVFGPRRTYNKSTGATIPTTPLVASSDQHFMQQPTVVTPQDQDQNRQY